MIYQAKLTVRKDEQPRIIIRGIFKILGGVMKFKIDATLHGNQTLELTTSCKSPVTKMTEQISREIINFQDEAIRKALIKLGWTPPPENKK